MSTAHEAATQTAAATAVAEGSLLEQAIAATKQTERDRAADLIKTLTEEALKGTLTWSKNVTRTITQGIKAIDAAMSKQLAAVMHNPKFQQLEGTWRGLTYLVMNSETSAQLKLKVLNIPKRELFKDLDKAIEFDQSQNLQEALRERVRLARRRAVRRVDRRLRVHEPSGRPRHAGQDVAGGGGGVLPLHFRQLAHAFRFRELHGIVQTARSGEDLRNR